jgi:hypothetical protein
LALLVLATPAVSLDFNNGEVNNFSGDIGAAGIRVYDDALNNPTTLNLIAGAKFNGLFAYDFSIVTVSAGTTSAQDINALNNSMVSVFGGNAQGADADDEAHLIISDGHFTRSGRVVGAFGDSIVDISGGQFDALGSAIALIAFDTSEMNVSGGQMNGAVRADQDSRILITGGQIPGITATDRSIITIIGEEFVIPSLGSIDLAVPYVIDESLDDTISGILADGTALNADIFNGLDSQIILQAIPEPVSLFVLGGGIGLIAQRSRRPGQEN